MTSGAERRSSERHLACVAAHVASPEGTQLNVIRELSVEGAQLLTQMRPEVDARIDLRLYLDHEHPEEPYPVAGRVVRVERREGASLWRYLVAVRFERPLLGLDRQIAALAARQAEVCEEPPTR